MHFTRLRLSGFKSFVDPTELVIEPGLTGVVGPNGCGKSNLLEALRWVMGENSAKSMRGNGMDDVIFAGTSTRPARNLAEVTLSLDNQDRTAPSAFNDEIDLEISRRIERDSGSAYRVNGKEIRGKDVKLMFADASTGAHSPSLVSQGRIGSLISAKPKERRAILEEAAGISGLHSRRNEAESKLKSADKNLERLGDVEIGLQEQIRNLKNQARQATRYKNVAGEIRKLQALLLYIEWQTIEKNIGTTSRDEREVSLIVAKVTAELAALSKEQAIIASGLPELRQNEAELAAKLHRITVSRDSLDGEEQRVIETQEKLKALLIQIDQDEEREKDVIKDSLSTMERLEVEKKFLEDEIAGAKGNIEQLAKNLQEKQSDTLDAELALEELTGRLAERNADRINFTREIEERRGQIQNLEDQKVTVEERLSTLENNNLFTQTLSGAEKKLKAAEQQITKMRLAFNEAEDKRQSIQQMEQEARNLLQMCESKLARVKAEKEALEEVLSADFDGKGIPLLEKLSVKKGYETALGAALNSDLDASDDPQYSVHWRELPPLGENNKFPQGVETLDQFVKAPSILKRRLCQIGVVDSEEKALEILKDLKAGQRLVTLGGGLWRWDGLCVSPDAPSGAAIRLAQKNRLENLKNEYSEKEKEVLKASEKHSKFSEELSSIKDISRAARDEWRKADEEAINARREMTEAEKLAARHQSEETALKDRQAHIVQDLKDQNIRYKAAIENLEKLPEMVELEELIAQNRENVEARRREFSEARIAHDSHQNQSEMRLKRLEQINSEYDNWQVRIRNVNNHLENLAIRSEETKKELSTLENRPGEIVVERRKLNVLIDEAETERKAAAIKLAEAENTLASKEREMREVQSRVSEARERKVRLETNLEQFIEQKDHLGRRIQEEFDHEPAELFALAELNEGDELPDEDESHQKLERLKIERERLGAVNLRAEIELEEINAQLDASIKEREELEEAIKRLNKAISDLNREGRARLLKAFDEVNNHFKDLFTTLFGGGEAFLELTESDDPLDAGLEIMASPPGKKMQNLGLLSGGEQALTALSLIFAVFMTNPSPICVLDEVDAPLDDANVERFCDLLDEMRKNTTTRFLIVTHNAISMSRMNRLYGVTMAERGVSQLVSVDLESAEKIRDRVTDSHFQNA
ncbi:MAG: chromosome segregation protein SMC [Alphaproteobacteria bacterium]|nr:chromosome segregation protein SMC [Alphaproteobacteria bacterium]HPF46528.1 chromosome segregation protein SMC [Emcibacteraceae bacterium]